VGTEDCGSTCTNMWYQSSPTDPPDTRRGAHEAARIGGLRGWDGIGIVGCGMDCRGVCGEGRLEALKKEGERGEGGRGKGEGEGTVCCGGASQRHRARKGELW
jgi:hypothetical protein